MSVIQPLLGLAGFLGLAWLCSERRDRFPWRTVAAGLGLQVLLAFLILRTQTGAALFSGMDAAFRSLLSFADEGSVMVFGALGRVSFLEEHWGRDNAFIFAVTVTGSIVFVSALSAALYHYGILQKVVSAAAWLMKRIMGTSGSESLAAAANVFMGQTEAPLVVQPYLAKMTRSELMALMVGGMATIAGGVLAAYVAFGISAGHLLTASVISAPAALMMAKVLLPETEDSPTRAGAAFNFPKQTVNGVDALCQGAADGVRLAINVMAMLIAFVAVVALVNQLLALGLAQAGLNVERPLQAGLAWLQAPFAWLMGVPAADCLQAGAVLGERIVLNEFMGYISLAGARETMDPRSVMILTYALCGFANFASIAIQIGGIGSLAESRRHDLARLGLKAMMGGLLACYMTAALASLMAPVVEGRP
jgi:CNT family concentrative nucleoside transporter